ncbi:hypothetical protein MCOR25_004543 [Pyricularia grisea]|nr:hypothetical protein MCOR25_004543 [Pyricularia grisea]
MSVDSDDGAESSGANSPRNTSRASRASNVNARTAKASPAQKTKVTHTIDRTPEYEEFITKLRAYHKQRGTSFEPEPWVGSAHLDLLKVFKHVVAAGGYDHVSATTLEWRKLATELGLDVTDRSAAGVAYALKSAFLKYLAAWEIQTIHNKEPPPPLILEHESAKGGGLLTRTLENYTPKKAVPAAARAPSVAASASENDETPRKDTPRAGGTTRSLRVAPPQRVIFQPDTGPSRQTRHAAAPAQQPAQPPPATNTPPAQQPKTQYQPPPHSHPTPIAGHPQPGHPPPHMGNQVRGPSVNYSPQDPELMSALVQNFEPRLESPMQMRPVETPANNPVEFERRRRQEKFKAAGMKSTQLAIRPPPGTTVFEGPNIYMRCLCALRSGIPSEQAYALHHLVKISFERGDKFKFETFAGLAEGLVEKALEVGGLYFDVNWTVDYSGDPDESDPEVLDGLNGTPDILDRIAKLQPKTYLDNIQPADAADRMVHVTEAVLTIRNMVTLQENAVLMADFNVLRDLICIILHLPNSDTVVEIKHLALDIAEQLAPYIVLETLDPLYQTLLAQLHSTDRGMILTSLRAIARLSINLGETSQVHDVPASILQNILDWLLLNDDEMIDACLDFLYTYTSHFVNVETLLKDVNAAYLVNHLVRLLSHGAKKFQREVVLEKESKLPSTDFVQPVPEDLRQQLLAMEEPERCYAWLKCLFEEDPESAITQIAIWQAFQAALSFPLQQMSRPMMGAAEFIRNVSHVFTHAGAQIVKEQGERGEIQRFIIKGVRPRIRPIAQDGTEYLPCMWRIPVPRNPNDPSAPLRVVNCGQHFLTPEKMYNHIIDDHLKESRDPSGKFMAKERDLFCAWGECNKYPRPQKMQLSTLMNHVKTHCAAAQQNAIVSLNTDGRRPRRTFIARPAKTINVSFEETAAVRDERSNQAQAAGIPLSSALVLRNIARNVSKFDGGVEDSSEGGDASGKTLELLFRPVTARLCEIMMKNWLLAPYVTQILEITRDNY